MTAPETPLSATETARKASPHRGACSCGAESLSSCSCSWGVLLDRLHTAGYVLTRWEAIRQLSALMAEASAEMTAQRTRLLQEAADVWPESPADFAEYYGISRSRLSQLGIRFPQRSKTIIYGPPIQ